MKTGFTSRLASTVLSAGLMLAACTAAPSGTAVPGGEADTPAPNGNAGEPVRLSFVGWGGPDELDVFRNLVDTFNANNPDIFIEYTPMPDDYVTKLKTMIAGGTPPDIAYVPDGDFSAFAPRGTLVNIQQFVAASDVINEDEIWPTALDRYRYDSETRALGSGDLYALPKDIGPTVLYINKDMFAANNVPLPDPTVPLTWDQVIEIGQQLTLDANGNRPLDPGFDPNAIVQWGVGDLWMENTAYSNGGQLLSEDGRTFVGTSPETLAAIQFIADLRHRYNVYPSTQQTSSQSIGQLFETGKLGMTTNGRWAVTSYRNTLGFDWDVRPIPVGPSGQVYAADENCAFSGWSGSVGLAIIAGSNGERYPEQAFRFIEFIAGAEGQAEQAALGFQIPNQIALAESEVFLQPGQKPENAQVFLEAARCEFPGPWTRVPSWNAWFDPLFWQGAWIEVVNENAATAEQAMTSRQQEFQSGLDEAWATLDQ